MIEIGNNKMSLNEYSDIAYEAIESDESINNVVHTTRSGQRYSRSTGVPIITYRVVFDTLEKSEYEAIRQFCSPRSIKNYYVRYKNSEDTVIFEGFARLVISDIQIDKDSRLYAFGVEIEMEVN